MNKFKKLKEDKQGLSTLIMVAVVVIIIIVAASFVFLTPGLSGGKKLGTAEATIYIQDSNGNISSAKVSLSQPNFQEGMMLDFKQGIRQTDFQPLDTVKYTATSSGGMWPTGKYTIWASVTYTITATNIDSITSSTVTFTGQSGNDVTATGTPTHTTCGMVLITTIPGTGNIAGYTTTVTATKTTGLSAGTPMTISQTDSSYGNAGKYSQMIGGGGPYPVGATPLDGKSVDGTWINVNLSVNGLDGGGATHTAIAGAVLQINVASWNTGTMSVAITGVSGSGF